MCSLPNDPAAPAPPRRRTHSMAPVLGPSGRVPGLHYAFGFNGEGFAISPGVGEVMAELLATGRTSTPIEAFSIGRFAAARQDQAITT